jgi:hypothetical protein
MGCWRTINGNRAYIENCGGSWKATALDTVALVAGAGDAGEASAGGVGAAGGGSGVSVGGADVGVRVKIKARDRSSRSVLHTGSNKWRRTSRRSLPRACRRTPYISALAPRRECRSQGSNLLSLC